MSWQETELRIGLESVVGSIELATNPRSPQPMTRDQIVDVLVPQLLNSAKGYLEATATRDEQVQKNLKLRLNSGDATYDAALQGVIDGIEARRVP